jgi:peroxiredoxin
VATFMQDEGLTFPVLTDSAQKAVGQYGVSGVPTTFFIDEEGVIQYKKVGYFHSLEDIEDILNQLFDW